MNDAGDSIQSQALETRVDDARLGHRIIDWYLWSWRIPELRAVPTSAARRAAFREAHLQLSSMRGGLSWLLLLLFLAPGLRFAPRVTALVMGVVVLSVLFDRPKLRELRRGVRRHLNEAGIPTCMRCGYSMRGIKAEMCPECGGEWREPTTSPRKAKE